MIEQMELFSGWSACPWSILALTGCWKAKPPQVIIPNGIESPFELLKARVVADPPHCWLVWCSGWWIVGQQFGLLCHSLYCILWRWGTKGHAASFWMRQMVYLIHCNHTVTAVALHECGARHCQSMVNQSISMAFPWRKQQKNDETARRKCASTDTAE